MSGWKGLPGKGREWERNQTDQHSRACGQDVGTDAGAGRAGPGSTRRSLKKLSKETQRQSNLPSPTGQVPRGTASPSGTSAGVCPSRIPWRLPRDRPLCQGWRTDGTSVLSPCTSHTDGCCAQSCACASALRLLVLGQEVPETKNLISARVSHSPRASGRVSAMAS